MADDMNNISPKALQVLLDEWLAANPESPLWQQRAEIEAQIDRSLKRLKAVLESRLQRVVSEQEVTKLLQKRLKAYKGSNLIQALQAYVAELEQTRSSKGIVAGLRALAGRPPKQRQTLETLKFPATASLIFSCQLCDKGILLENGSRTFLSMEQAQQVMGEFSRDLEPKTIECSCGYEAEYHPEDLALYVLPEKRPGSGLT